MTEENLIRVASFDVGKVNFAFCVEEMNRSELLNLKNVPKLKRYNSDGTPTPTFSLILKNVCQNGKIVLFKNCNLTKNCSKGKYLDPETFHNLTDLLDEYTEYWNKCEAFIIEQQMSFGKRHNTLALKLGQHCYSYFIFRYGRFKQVVEFPSYHKTQVLGASKIECKTKKGKVSYKAMDKPTRKKWSVEKANTILADRDDFKTMAEMSSKKKQDDLADVLCQLQAFKYLAFVDRSI